MTFAVDLNANSADRIYESWSVLSGKTAKHNWIADLVAPTAAADLAAFYANLDGASNAHLDSASVVIKNAVTGQKIAPTNPTTQGISNMTILVFVGTSLGFNGKPVYYKRPIFAPIAGTLDAANNVIIVETHIAGIITYLVANKPILTGYAGGSPDYAEGTTFVRAEYVTKGAIVSGDA